MYGKRDPAVQMTRDMEEQKRVTMEFVKSLREK